CGARLPSYRLRRGRTVLGRHADSDCVIDDPHASRQQLAIEWDDERLRIEPLAPKNPVTIERVDDAGDLVPGSVIRFGDTVVTVRGLRRTAESSADDTVRVVVDDPGAWTSIDPRGTASWADARSWSERRLESLYALTELLVRSDPSDSDWLQSVAELIFPALPAGRGFIAVGDPAAEGLGRVHAWPSDRTHADEPSIPMSQTILDAIQLEGCALIVPDVRADFGREAERSIDQIGIATFVCAPLIVGETALGFVYADRLRGEGDDPFSESDLRFVTGVAHLVALGLDQRDLRDRLERENFQLRQVMRRRTEIVAQCPAMVEVLDTLVRAAERDSSVLLLGETGTGKELFARVLHDRSARSSGPFVAFNCSLSNPALIESELFGHVRGAFTDAGRDHRGKFQLADGGTLFLDEIGDMPLDTQVRLLRVLQERRVWPVGSEKPVPFDVRLVAATHRDLSRLRKEGQFRDDLYFRIAVLTVEIPPLRERGRDVLEIAASFLPPEVRIESAAERALLAYGWPGNVRELQNAVERACFNAAGRRIRLQDLPADIAKEGRRDPVSIPLATLSETEAKHIRKVLRAVDHNKKRAAEILGIARDTLYQKLRAFGIDA
ncbi:MAG: sigma 54-interacting transcriptional regulator, partial [Planctomycetes bacterium]|nr:sigma 54-interacting transcriptional regulator [Planctomycetota bacterium]